jgi:transposase
LIDLVRSLLERVAILEAENVVLKKENALLKAENASLKAENLRLQEEVRASKRPNAPFSKGTRKADPKKPGRKPGQGPFIRRAEPVPGPADQVEHLSAPLDATTCPQCGANLEIKEETATVEDIPPEPPRVIKRFRVETGWCPVCGWRGWGAHPDLAANQYGASAHRVGPCVLAHALKLHYHDGLPLCKVPAVIKTLSGISLSQSALTQAAGKLCDEGGVVAVAYLGLREELRRSKVVNTDDTGWRIAAQQAYLMGFFTLTIAIFQIRWRHRHEEVLEMLGHLFRGLLGTDRGTSYEARRLDHLKMQKCLSHLLKNLSMVEAMLEGPAVTFTQNVKAILREALKLWHDYKDKKCTRKVFRERGLIIKEKLDRELRIRELPEPENQRLLDGIGAQHDNGRVLLFLEHPEIEPTNNRAERGLRGAVIARKISHCSKNERGAGIYEKMKSITATIALRGIDVAKGLADLIMGRPMPSAVGR